MKRNPTLHQLEIMMVLAKHLNITQAANLPIPTRTVSRPAPPSRPPGPTADMASAAPLGSSTSRSKPLAQRPQA